MNDMRIQDNKLFKIGLAFERKWYKQGEKSSKSRLGMLHHATIKNHAKDRERHCIARLIHMERISAYTIESFQKRMILLL